MGKRVAQNDQKLRVLQENHSESVRYLREYRDNFRNISSEFAQQAPSVASSTNQNLIGEMSGDQMSVNQSYGGLPGSFSNKYQAEITQLNQEIFHLRTQLADAKQNGLLDLNELRNNLDLLNSENASL